MQDILDAMDATMNAATLNASQCMLYMLTSIESSAVTIASGASGTVSGSTTVDFTNDLEETSSSGGVIWHVRSVPYAWSWCIGNGLFVPTLSGNKISLSATAVNPSSSSHNCSIKWGVFIFKRIEW